MCPFILYGSCLISEGYPLLATLNWVTGERLLTASCVNIFYVFITNHKDWSPKVERTWWEIRVLVFDLPGNILLCGNLFYVLSWVLSTLGIQKSPMHVVIRLVSWCGKRVLRIFFFSFDKAWLSELLSCYGLKINLIWQSTWSMDFVILDDACPFSEALKPLRGGEGDQSMVI